MNETKGKHNGLGIAGFVVALCSYIIFGIPCGIVGLCLSVAGRNKAVATGGKTGLATAGIVLAIISLALNILLNILI